jgi:hypothetical protein
MTKTLERPAEPAGALYFKTPVTPEEIFQAIGRLRKEARDEIDRLIRFLDETDNHMEREPDGSDEPTLGWSIGGQYGDDRDLEIEEGDDEPDAEGEPSLGSVGIHSHDQRVWADGDRRDLEDEHDGAEPDECGEPSLGSFDRMTNQEHSWIAQVDGWNASSDMEQDFAE